MPTEDQPEKLTTIVAKVGPRTLARMDDIETHYMLKHCAVLNRHQLVRLAIDHLYRHLLPQFKAPPKSRAVPAPTPFFWEDDEDEGPFPPVLNRPA